MRNREVDDIEMDLMLADALKKNASFIQKLYIDIDPNWSYEQMLTKLTKTELDQIRKFYKVPKSSGLNKKDLVERIVEDVPQKIEKWFECCQTEDLQLMHEYIGTKVYVTEDVENPELDYYFRKRGIVFPGLYGGEYVHVVPKVLIEQIKGLIDKDEITENAYKNTDIILVANGILEYWGVASKKSLVEKISSLFNSRFEDEYIERILGEYVLKEDRITEYNGYYQNLYVMDTELIIEEQDIRTEMDFYPVTFKEALKAGVLKHPIFTKEQLDLMNYLKERFEVTESEAVEMVLIAAEESNMNASLDDKLNFWSNQLMFEDANDLSEFLDHLRYAHNNTHLWVLKGNLPSMVNEAFDDELGLVEGPKQVVKSKKIGRNEPCPCGSGKKYKKCCINQ